MGSSAGWVARGVALALVFGMSVAAFRAGVDVSDRPGLPEAGLLSQLYYAAGLFVLGGLDLGTPVAGQPLQRGMLWATYFIAPLITTSAVVEGAMRLVGTRAFDKVGLRQHLVVIGLGSLGTTFVSAYRRRQRRNVVLAMDRDVTRPALLEIRRQHNVRLVPGDARIQASLSVLALEHAVGAALLTEDDLLNVEVAFRLAKRYPNLPIVAHASNIAMQRAAADLEPMLQRGHLHVFNAHRVAAEQLFGNHLAPFFESTAGKDTVVVAGFGRFGQTIVELLERQAAAEIETLVIADHAAELQWRAFSTQVSCESRTEPMPIDGDLQDPKLWVEIQERLGPLSEPPVVIVGSDKDSVNLQGVLAARSCWPECKAFVRFQHDSLFAEHLAERHGFVVLGVESKLLDALVSAQQQWFAQPERLESRPSPKPACPAPRQSSTG